MTAVIILSFRVSLSLIFPLMAQPLSLGLAIIISTLFICLLRAIFLSSWYGYILFLIYVGGLLVMFAYVAALSPNMLFKRASPVIVLFIIFRLLRILLYFKSFGDYSLVSSMDQFSGIKVLKSYGVELVSPDSISILISLALILLINLIVVVKICFYQHATLRPFYD